MFDDNNCCVQVTKRLKIVKQCYFVFKMIVCIRFEKKNSQLHIKIKHRRLKIKYYVFFIVPKI